MLDYAQLSAGKFRKLESKFDLVQCVSEILDVLGFKAKEIGISLKMNFELFEQTENI